MEKISVIIPVNKIDKILEKNIKSFLNQTYKNIELLLVCKKYEEKAEKYLQLDDRIKIVYDVDMLSFKKIGLENSTGKYIIFITSEIEAKEYLCECLYKNIKENDCDICFMAYENLESKDNLIVTSNKSEKIKENVSVVYNGEELVKEILTGKIINENTIKMYKRSILEKFKDNENFENNLLDYIVCKNIKKAIYINKIGYTIYNNSITYSSKKEVLQLYDLIHNRYELVKTNYSNLMIYNIMKLIDSVVELTEKNLYINRKDIEINKKIDELINIINIYMQFNEKELLSKLTDFQKSSVYLMQYNNELYYNFIKENLKNKKLD